jgi:hypothetical protein
MDLGIQLPEWVRTLETVFLFIIVFTLAALRESTPKWMMNAAFAYILYYLVRVVLANKYETQGMILYVMSLAVLFLVFYFYFVR